MRQAKLFKILSLACVLIFAASAGYAQVQNGDEIGLDDIADSRTLLGPDNYDPPSSTGGLDGMWGADDFFTISWLIEFDPTEEFWTYSYTLEGSMTASTFILESPDQNYIWDLYINGEPKEVGGAKDEFGTWWKNGKVGLVNYIVGHKFEVTGGDATTSTIQFKTVCDPVWGNFHTMGASGAKANEAYNMGLDNGEELDALDFIPRPEICGDPPDSGGGGKPPKPCKGKGCNK